jgi:hypothetical protein
MHPSDPTPRVPLPDAEEMAMRMNALTALRQQMLELHARLEYLRLMMRVNHLSPPR